MHLKSKPHSRVMQKLPSGVVGLAMVRKRSCGLILFPRDIWEPPK